MNCQIAALSLLSVLADVCSAQREGLLTESAPDEASLMFNVSHTSAVSMSQLVACLFQTCLDMFQTEA